MAAYQCLNCHQIERSDEDCCAEPDLFCINDMPGEILKLRALVREALAEYSIGYVLGADWVERANACTPRTPTR